VNSPCALFAANRGYALTSSRTGLILHFLRSGWRVVLATSNDEESRQLQAMGADLEPATFHRGGFSPSADYRAYKRLLQIYQCWQPALVHHFHAKPVILGTIAARRVLDRSTKVVNTITGLGNAFVSGGIAGRFAGFGYGLALPRADLTIFQNRDDLELFRKRGWVPPERARCIPGSGVDTSRFGFVDRSSRENERPVVVMLGRLLQQKGIPEFVEVARRVNRWQDVRFVVAGEEESGRSDAVSSNWLRSQPDVEYVGRLADVFPLLESADLLLYPSYYREGVPRVVVEAAATGLPTVAFDVPGVREAVRDGETGYLVPYRDIDAMTERVDRLLQDSGLRDRMGRAARRMAEDSFDIRSIQAQHLRLYRGLGLDVDLNNAAQG
jgi:glycosyltransferase involved in cell wall biosynthesis